MFVKIRSWHVVKESAANGVNWTLCGRRVMSMVLAADFGDEKTCETCLRVLAKQ